MKKLFILTGSSRGLGKALLNQLTNKKCLVLNVIRNKQDYIDNPNQYFYYTDFRELDFDISNIIEKIFIEHTIDEIVFINNAGVIKPISKMENVADFNDIENHVRVNYLAPMRLINQILNVREDKKLKIINITSGAAKRPIPGWALYCSSKAAISMYLKTVQSECQRVYLREIDPGVMDTDMQFFIRETKESDFPLVKEFIDYKEQDRLKEPNDVAKEILMEYLQ